MSDTPVNLVEVVDRARNVTTIKNSITRTAFLDYHTADQYIPALEASQADVRQLVDAIADNNDLLNRLRALRDTWATDGSPTGDPDNALFALTDILGTGITTSTAGVH